MSDWKPMTEHKFPWPHRDLIVVAYESDALTIIDVLRVTCAEHGALFSKNTAFLSIHEEGWVPFAWRIDDTPARDDEAWPPLLTDYLTEPRDAK